MGAFLSIGVGSDQLRPSLEHEMFARAADRLDTTLEDRPEHLLQALTGRS
jgi:hypothetical protein